LTSPALAALDALFPGPGTARDWMREELSGREYRPSLSERFWHWVQDLFDRVRDASVGAGGFNPVVALIILALVIALAALVLSRLRANPAGETTAGALFTEARMSAADHRALAQRALTRGDWDTTLVESMRALAAGLFERGLVVEETGATAHEISATAGQSFPAEQDRLERAAVSFDETRYGERPATEPGAREVLALEEELRSASSSRGAFTGPVAAVPR
jgi:Domain of unknown function (DUF4129)